MVKIGDVSKHAGVSNSLVSRFLNNKPGVGEKNRIKIQEAINILGYRRNDIARSLVQQRTGAIGIVLDTICQTFLFDLIKGLETAGQEYGFKIIFCDCMGDPKTKLDYINYLSHSRVDGLVMYGSFFTDNHIAVELSRSHFPFVLIENNVMDVKTNKVLIDNQDGVEQIINHLFQKGHRDIRMICWDMGAFAGKERYEGYKNAMKKCGLPLDENHIYCKTKEGTTREDVRKTMNALIDNHDLPDALFFGADELAFEAMLVLKERNIKVPEDIAITGFDHDVYINNDFLMPRLTTIKQPLLEAGKSAIQLLADTILNSNSEPKVITLLGKLIIGETS